MSEQAFKAAIIANFRGLWSGSLDNLSFADAMFASIGRGFEQAWQEGAKECGVLPDERTEEEQAKLNLMIGDNFQYVGALADWLFQHSKANGVKFAGVQYRADLWVNRYQEVRAAAQTMACGDRKYQWAIDGGEHCRSCLKLNGRVARASVWASRVTPRTLDGKLACGGYNCKCSLIETDAPATRGRWPNLP